MSTPFDFLFPVPALPQSELSPSHSPDVSPDSTSTLQNVLKDNHARWHIFFNEQRFHNHAAHRAIASWALGADASTIQCGYQKDCRYEKPAFKSPAPITAENFKEHLGDDKYFNSYMEFFTSFVKEKGIPAALEEFVFSLKANIGSKADSPPEKQPQMLSRFFSGILHPMIHSGYGAEFGLPGMIVEGLAQTAVHLASPGVLAPLSLFEDSDLVSNTRLAMIAGAGEAIGSAFSKGVNALESALDKVLPESLHLDSNGSEGKLGGGISGNMGGTHALTILARVLRDPEFKVALANSSTNDDNDMFKSVVQKHGKALGAYVNQWEIDVSEGKSLKKIEELVWVVCVLYGVCGWTYRDGQKFNADFFFMHLVTSSIFLPALCALLTPTSQIRLLKGYLMTVLTWAVARGRPAVDIEGFVVEMLDPKSVPTPLLTPKWESAWMRIVEEARRHHDEHVTKIIRTLAGWAGAFGTRRARVGLQPNTPTTRYDRNRILTRDEAECAGLGMGVGGPNEETADEKMADEETANERGRRAFQDGNREKNDVTEAAEFIPGEGPVRAASLGPAAYMAEAFDADQGRPVLNEDPNVLPHTELPGSEYLDGRLFLRVAVLTLGRMGWHLEGENKKQPSKMRKRKKEEEEFWDFQGFFVKRGGTREIVKAKI